MCLSAELAHLLAWINHEILRALEHAKAGESWRLPLISSVLISASRVQLVSGNVVFITCQLALALSSSLRSSLDFRMRNVKNFPDFVSELLVILSSIVSFYL
jgi:hypothetical protein